MGCTLYFLLTGQPVFGGETVMERILAHREHPVPSLRKACHAAPKWLDAVFRKMVAKKPEDRYQSATALVSDLERHAAPRSWRWLWIMVVLLLAAAGAWGAITLSKNALHGDKPAQQKPLDLPVKASWRTTGEYPLIAGRWCEWEEKGLFVEVRQYGGEFVATATYKDGDVQASWRAEGKISKSGHVTAKLVHTHQHEPDQWLPQTRTAVLEPDGKSIHGYAAWVGGGHEFTWDLREPREAEEKELSP